MLANDSELKKLESETVCDDEILKKNEKTKSNGDQSHSDEEDDIH